MIFVKIFDKIALIIQEKAVNFDLHQTDITWLIIAGLFIISLFIQLFYYFFFFLRLVRPKRRVETVPSGEPVSVVICARNEEHNLERNLPAILEQDYPEFEVVVVNDSSEDNTEEVLGRLKKRYGNLKSTRINKDRKFRHGKKLALTIGLKAASHDWVLLTDADCKPASNLWISLMQKHFVSPLEVVLGYGGYEPSPGLLNKIVRYDTFFIAMQYFSFALAGFPYMGVGRNLAYKKSLFFDNKGFASHLKLESGDDDLFINEVANKTNTGVELSHPAHTCSSPPRSWKSWYRQKKRHLTTGFHYRPVHRALLGTEIFSRVLFYGTFIALALNNIFLHFVIGLFLIHLIAGLAIRKIGMTRLNEKNLLLISPLLEIIIILFNIFCVAGNIVTIKRSRWR